MNSNDTYIYIGDKECFSVEKIEVTSVFGDLYPVKGIIYFKAEDLDGIHPLNIFPALKGVFDIIGVMSNKEGDNRCWSMCDCQILDIQDIFSFSTRNIIPALEVKISFEAKVYSTPHKWESTVFRNLNDIEKDVDEALNDS